ncbi:MAG TPA: AAA domain-containing protein, partial [Nakamurella sp.]
MLLVGAVPAADAARAFDAGVAATSLSERAAATGLGGFDPVAHDGSVTTFVSSADRVRDQLLTAIPAGLIRERTFDAASGYGRIGELTRELAKQRRGLAVRGLMTRFGDLITRIMPCTLVSPDSLARFFPPQPGLFDLVVFDEASQIRVADAIGALGRADAAVVVGDSKQMPPSSFAESTWIGSADGGRSGHDGGTAGDAMDFDPDEVTETAVEDEESILAECVQAGLTRRWLSWHYRSQDETLIAFSNRRYYEDRLSSFPSPISGAADPSTHGHGVNLVRVQGTFLRSGAGQSLRTNPIEAVAVVTEIRDRFAAATESVPSIGVVTFNAQQRTHIEALLRDLHDERITEALDRTDGEGLFVKNLENVQGDERDVILFSTAFSANARGVLPLNFGPLNQVGGERRLNVAITRARRQVIVFSSFDPKDLRAEETSSQGIKDLRAYLDLALAGSGDSVGTSPRAPAADRHRDEIAAALRDRGMPVATNVGLSDFTLDLAVGRQRAVGQDRDPEGASIAVLLDGPSWAGRRTVGDRDGLPVDVLSRLMGWPVVRRVWLPEWLHDRDGVLDRLLSAAVDKAPSGADAGMSSTPSELPAVDPGPGTSAPFVSTSGTPTPPPTVDSPEATTGSSSRGPDRPEATTPASAFHATPTDTMTVSFTPDGDDITGLRSPAAPVDDTGEDGSGPESLPGESAFLPWRSGYLGGRDVLDALPRPSSVERVARALAAGMEAEGPI